MKISGKVWREWASLMKLSLYLALLIIVINALVSYEGSHVLYQFSFKLPLLGTPRITFEAIIFGIGNALRLLAIMSAFAVLTLTIHPDDLMLAMVGERLNDDDTEAGFLFDGFPRTVNQAIGLETLAVSQDRKLDAIISIHVDKDILLHRLTARRTCRNCNAVYNLVIKPPKENGICDVCGSSDLVQRRDDKPETILERLNIFEQHTFPLLAYYKPSNRLAEISGIGTIDEVFQSIVDAAAALSS